MRSTRAAGSGWSIRSTEPSPSFPGSRNGAFRSPMSTGWSWNSAASSRLHATSSSQEAGAFRRRSTARRSPGTGASLGDGITAVGHSPRVPVERFLPVIEGVLRQGGMFYRSGSGALSLCDVACGRLLAYVEVHINSWDCLGAVAVLRAAGLRTTNMTASVEALLEGAPIAVANAPDIYARLVKLVAPEQGAA